MAEIRKNNGNMMFSDDDLSLAELVVAQRSYLREANLSEANLHRANLSETGLRRTNLSEANLRGANLRAANLRGANLRAANLRGANLSRANLRFADLRGANLRFANLSEADLHRAYLAEANLTGADLRGANLTGANLRCADLCGANLSEAKGLLNPKDWLNANFERDELGYIVYKDFGTYYNPPKHWDIKSGSFIIEEVDFNRTNPCGCGINFAAKEYFGDDCDLWKCLLAFEDLMLVTVPYNTYGQARCGRVQLIGKLESK
jgi:uncharacterized protein YjbI with pentapeptide repeats